MTKFLLPRELRKRKRAIYAQAHKALGDLKEALRDMHEFTEEVRPLYDHLGDAAWPDDNAIRVLLESLNSIELTQRSKNLDDILAIFNHMREEI